MAEDANIEICHSSYCSSPNVSISIPDLHDVLMRFAGFAIANAVAHAVVLDSYQNCISQDEVEKRVLQRCLSGELAGVSEIPPMSEAEEIALEDKVAQLVFIENPRAGPFSVYRRIAGCVDASILDTFRQIQNVIDDSQDADSSTYCLHDLYNRRIDFLAMEKATYRLLAPQSDPIVSPRLDREIRCAVAAGRANGVDLRVMLNAAVVWKAQGDRTLRQAAIRALSGTVLTRYNPLFTSFAFLSTHIQSHNNTPLFLADMYRSLVSELPPFKPVSLPPSLPLLTTALLPFPDLKRPHLFSSASTICTPRCCPPDICSSGKRPPIKENYELAEELFMSLFSIRCDALALRAIAPTAEARAMMAVELVRQSGLMDVGKDHQRRALVIVLPSIYAESQIKLCRLAAGKNELLPEVVGCLYKTLSAATGEKFVCFCDLTNSCAQLREAIKLAELDYKTRCAELVDYANSTDYDPNITPALFREYSLDHAAGFPAQWESKVESFLAFIDPHISALTRCPHTQLVGFAPLRALALQKGVVGILEEIWGILGKEFPLPPAGEFIILPALRDLTRHLAVCENPQASAPSFEDKAFRWYSAGGLPKARELYAQIHTLSPFDWQSRINSAGIRLQLANDRDQQFQWSRAISDCTIAIYYGCTSSKAYYRRGVALAHLKLWRKAVLDFEQALAMEPHNVLLKQRLALARMRRT